ncbi:MAG: glycosyltransferase family 9 protein [Acetobacteraceae bacterium]|nr:glycosyltransferase family 9 protein [Acetobacteraceae bacterium]
MVFSPNVAVVQPLPGIGDMIWHLPHIRAIAAHVGAPVTLLAKPRSLADQIFQAETTVRDVLWVDRNPERRQGRHDGGSGWLRLVASLRARRFTSVYVLHHSRTLAFLALAAGIPVRHGYGYGTQRLFLNRGPYLPNAAFPLHPFEQASAWLAAAGIPVADAEPILPVADAARVALRERLGDTPGPLVAIGVGSSEPYKQWGAERFADLASGLQAAGWRRLVLVGGPAEASLIDAIRGRLGEAADDVTAAAGWPLPAVAALFEAASFYVGNDTGVMNMAAAVGIRTYSLFGATPPFHHSSRIVAIVPPEGVDKATGMARITPEAVLAAIQADRGSLSPALSRGA